MIKKIICLGVMLIMILATFISCTGDANENNGISVNFNVSYKEAPMRGSIGISNYSLFSKVNSLQDLISMSDENDYPFFDADDANYNGDLSVKIREYDEEYFQDNALVLVFHFEQAGDYPAKIDSVYIDDDTLRITIARPILQRVNDVLSMYVFLIEVDKEAVALANNVEVLQSIKGEIEDYL